MIELAITVLLFLLLLDPSVAGDGVVRRLAIILLALLALNAGRVR